MGSGRVGWGRVGWGRAGITCMLDGLTCDDFKILLKIVCKIVCKIGLTNVTSEVGGVGSGAVIGSFIPSSKS